MKVSDGTTGRSWESKARLLNKQMHQRKESTPPALLEQKPRPPSHLLEQCPHADDTNTNTNRNTNTNGDTNINTNTLARSGRHTPYLDLGDLVLAEIQFLKFGKWFQVFHHPDAVCTELKHLQLCKIGLLRRMTSATRECREQPPNKQTTPKVRNTSAVVSEQEA